MARYTDPGLAAHHQYLAGQRAFEACLPEDDEAKQVEACEDDRVLAQIDALIVAAGATA